MRNRIELILMFRNEAEAEAEAWNEGRKENGRRRDNKQIREGDWVFLWPNNASAPLRTRSLTLLLSHLWFLLADTGNRVSSRFPLTETITLVQYLLSVNRNM